VLKGIMAPEDRARFEYGLEVVQELHREEANYLRSATSLSSENAIASGACVPSSLCAVRSGVQSSRYRVLAFWEPVLLRIKSGWQERWVIADFFAPRAQAQGECSQVGAGSPEAGSNLVAVCCNCTINGVPVGCLNAVCAGRPAIWDQATGICGCG
jgi:hypothetical protein